MNKIIDASPVKLPMSDHYLFSLILLNKLGALCVLAPLR